MPREDDDGRFQAVSRTPPPGRRDTSSSTQIKLLGQNGGRFDSVCCGRVLNLRCFPTNPKQIRCVHFSSLGCVSAFPLLFPPSISRLNLERNRLVGVLFSTLVNDKACRAA